MSPCVNCQWGCLWNIHSAGIQAVTGGRFRDKPGRKSTHPCGDHYMWYVDVICDWVLFEVRRPHQENTAHSLEDFNLKTACQVNKAEAVILKLHNDCVHVIHRDWSHLCLHCLGLWSSCSHPPLYSTAEYNIKHCLGSVWNLSHSIHYRCLKKGVSRFVSTLSEMREHIIGWRSHRWKYRYVCVCLSDYH